MILASYWVAMINKAIHKPNVIPLIEADITSFMRVSTEIMWTPSFCEISMLSLEVSQPKIYIL